MCIIITGGGTGGHLFSGIALATALQKNTGDIFLEIHTEKKKHGTPVKSINH